MTEKKYTLELSDKQLRLMVEALEVSARLQMGQFDYLRSFFLFNWPREKDPPYGNWAELDATLMALKHHFFPNEPYNGGPGIRSDKIPDHVRVLYDMLQVIAENSKKWGSVLKTGNHSLMKLKEIEDVSHDTTV